MSFTQNKNTLSSRKQTSRSKLSFKNSLIIQINNFSIYPQQREIYYLFKKYSLFLETLLPEINVKDHVSMNKSIGARRATASRSFVLRVCAKSCTEGHYLRCGIVVRNEVARETEPIYNKMIYVYTR
jgi:hypothetical protein